MLNNQRLNPKFLASALRIATRFAASPPGECGPGRRQGVVGSGGGAQWKATRGFFDPLRSIRSWIWSYSMNRWLWIICKDQKMFLLYNDHEFHEWLGYVKIHCFHNNIIHMLPRLVIFLWSSADVWFYGLMWIDFLWSFVKTYLATASMAHFVQFVDLPNLTKVNCRTKLEITGFGWSNR
jgi:hypothetical protein